MIATFLSFALFLFCFGLIVACLIAAGVKARNEKLKTPEQKEAETYNYRLAIVQKANRGENIFWDWVKHFTNVSTARYHDRLGQTIILGVMLGIFCTFGLIMVTIGLFSYESFDAMVKEGGLRELLRMVVLWGVINGGVVAVVLKDFLSWKRLVLEGDPGAW